MKNFIIIAFIILSSSIAQEAYDFSGLYEGQQCKRICKDKDGGLDKFLKNLPVLWRH